MLRSVASKVAWVGRTASMVFGLALVLALMVGMASAAFGANGDNFVLGVLNNSATAITRLTGNVSGNAALQVINPNTAAGSRALHLQVAANKPPLTVNTTAGKATNLNADKLDGHDAPLWAVVDYAGNLSRGNGVTSIRKLTGVSGQYGVYFNRDVSQCAFSATLTQGGHVLVHNAGDSASGVFVNTKNYAGNDADSGFHLVVNC